MMTLRGTTVPTLLLWLVLAVSIPLLVFTVGTVWRVQSTQRQQEETALVYQARDASQSLDRTFERVEDGLRTLAGSSALGRGDLDAFGQEMRGLSGRLGGITIALAAPDGNIVLHVPGSGSPVDREPVRQSVSAALRAGVPVISNLLPAGDLAQQKVVVAVPAFRMGVAAPPYILLGEIDGARLARLVAAQPRNPDGLVISIRDRAGTAAGISRSCDPGLSRGDRGPALGCAAGSGDHRQAWRRSEHSAWRRSADTRSWRRCPEMRLGRGFART